MCYPPQHLLVGNVRLSALHRYVPTSQPVFPSRPSTLARPRCLSEWRLCCLCVPTRARAEITIPRVFWVIFKIFKKYLIVVRPPSLKLDQLRRKKRKSRLCRVWLGDEAINGVKLFSNNKQNIHFKFEHEIIRGVYLRREDGVGSVSDSLDSTWRKSLFSQGL